MAQTTVFTDDDLGVRFEVDARFRPAPRDAGETAAALGRLNMAHAYFVAEDEAEGWQAVLSIAAVEVEYETTRDKLAEQVAIHNRYVVVTAAKGGWTLIRPWELTGLCGHPAMRNEYVTPHLDEGQANAARDWAPAAAGPAAATPYAGSSAAAFGATHVQGWTAYVGRRTYQVILGVDLRDVDAVALAQQDGDALRAQPPEWLTRDRLLAELPLRTFELLNVS